MTTTQTSEGVGQSCSVAPSPNMSPVRYVDQPVQTSHHLSKSFTDVATDLENGQEHKLLCVNHSYTQDDTHDTRKPDRIQNFMSKSTGRILDDKGNIVEETYMQMDPASTITHSLRGGWDEPFLESKMNQEA